MCSVDFFRETIYWKLHNIKRFFTKVTFATERIAGKSYVLILERTVKCKFLEVGISWCKCYEVAKYVE